MGATPSAPARASAPATAVGTTRSPFRVLATRRSTATASASPPTTYRSGAVAAPTRRPNPKARATSGPAALTALAGTTADARTRGRAPEALRTSLATSRPPAP